VAELPATGSAHSARRSKWSSDAQERSKIAREFLRRVESADSTPEQEAFFAQPSWQEFALEMRKWVCEPVNYEALLDDLERLEATGSEDAARDFAGHYQILRCRHCPPPRSWAIASTCITAMPMCESRFPASC